MTNMIVVGLVVAMIVSPTLCYPSYREEVENEWFQTESPEGAENEWFQTESPAEGAENEWFQIESPEGAENEWFQTESPEGAENEWFQTESPEGAENEWFQPPTPVEDEDVFEMEDAEIEAAGCGTKIYVMAFTSGIKNAGSVPGHHMTIELNTREKKDVLLYNRRGNDMSPNKGDLWQFTISSLHFRTNRCIRKGDIKEIIIHYGGKDGWNIESIVTILRSGNSYQMLTANMHVNRWLDSNRGIAERQYVLTKV